jgi:hypothetical protein
MHVYVAADAFRFRSVDGILLYENSLAVVDACIRAMEGGRLPVLAQDAGLYLWEYFVFTVDQTARICALLHQRWLPPSLLWRSHFSRPHLFSKSRTVLDVSFVWTDPVAMSTLSNIEFLWQDLQVVKAWIHGQPPVFNKIEKAKADWINAEVDKRQQWFAGARRAWLAAVVIL